jgi:hypothetical protein
MKTLSQALQDLKFPDDSNYELHLKQRSFKQGVRFAQEWIQVEKELPKERQLVIAYVNIFKPNSYGTTLGYYFDGKWHLQSDCNVIHPRVDYWRPLERN